MHEWALAEGVVFTALKVADQKGAKSVSKIEVSLGELQQVDKGIFKLALNELAKGTKAAGAKIVLQRNKAEFKCNLCGKAWDFRAGRSTESELIHFLPDIVHAYVRCPSCGSPDFSIEKGRGVWIESVELR